MNINIARESKEGRVLLDVGDLMRSVHPSIRSAMELSLCYADRVKGIATNQDTGETDQPKQIRSGCLPLAVSYQQ